LSTLICIRHDVELFAGFLANDMFAATSGTSQLVLGQVLNHIDTWQISRQWLTLASALGRGNDFFVRMVNHSQQRFAVHLVEGGA
jgi:hypothetical protein